MIDTSKHVLLSFSPIEVALDDASDDMALGVILWTHGGDIRTHDDQTQPSWIEWMGAAFPAEVRPKLAFLAIYRTNGLEIAA